MDSGFRRNDGFVVNRISRLRNDARIQAHTKSILNSNREGFFNSPLKGGVNFKGAHATNRSRGLFQLPLALGGSIPDASGGTRTLIRRDKALFLE